MNSGVSQTTPEAPLVGGLQLAMAAAAAVAVISLLRLPLAPNLSRSLNPEPKATTIDAAAELGLVDIEDPISAPPAPSEGPSTQVDPVDAVQSSSVVSASGPTSDAVASQPVTSTQLSGVEEARPALADPIELTGVETTSRSPAPIQSASTSSLRIVNQGPISVGFAIDGEIQRLAPGESLERDLDTECLVRYRCGGNHGIGSNVLAPGNYHFRVTADRGWQLEPITANIEGT